MPRHSDTSKAILHARPAAPETRFQPAGTGVQPLGFGRTRDGPVVIPPSQSDSPRPLIVLLHGAGADGASMLRLLQETS